MRHALSTAADLGKRRGSVELIRQAYRESWRNDFEASSSSKRG
jgi:hypothetical protein